MFKKPCPCGCGAKISKDAAHGMALVSMVRDFAKLLRDAANVADSDSERDRLLAIRDEDWGLRPTRSSCSTGSATTCPASEMRPRGWPRQIWRSRSRSSRSSTSNRRPHAARQWSGSRYSFPACSCASSTESCNVSVTTFHSGVSFVLADSHVTERAGHLVATHAGQRTEVPGCSRRRERANLRP